MQHKYIINAEERTVELEGFGDAMQATLDGMTRSIAAMSAGDGTLLLRIDGCNYPMRYARDEQGLHLGIKGLTFLLKTPGQESSGASGGEFEVVDGKQILVAPMPGQVVKVNVGLGDKVARKQCLVIVEAMKMENELVTVIDGTVTAVHVTAGQQVDALQHLIEVTQDE